MVTKSKLVLLLVFGTIQVLAATLLPLLTPIGRNLEYEYTLMVAALAWLVFPLALWNHPLRLFYLDAFDRRPGWGVRLGLWSLLLSPTLALMIPTLLLWTDVCPCSGKGFYFWWFLNTFPNWIMAHAVTLLLCGWTGSNGSRLRAYSAYLISLLMVFGAFAATMWLYPQKRMTSILWGVIHGPLYDHYIPVDEGMVLKRGSHVLMGLAILGLCWIASNRLRRLWVVVVALCAMALLLASYQFRSQGHGQRALREHLQYEISGDGYSLYHSIGSDTAGYESIKMLANEAAFHIGDLKKILGESAPHVSIFVYPDEKSKKLLFGGGSTDVADVVTPSIHITRHASPHPTLRHELVHALASEDAFFGLGFHPNMAFTEGLAIALAPRPRSISMDQSSIENIRSGRLGDASLLLSPMFWQVSGSRAYAAAGSMVTYIQKTYGFSKVLELYAGAPFEDAIAMSPSDFIEGWQTYLQENTAKSGYSLQAEAMHRSPSLFADYCPHTRALYEEGSASDKFDQWLQPPWLKTPSDYDQFLLRLDPKNKKVPLRRWQRQLKSQLPANSRFNSNLTPWIEQINQSRQWPPEVVEDIEVALLVADLYRINQQKELSRAILSDLKLFSKSNHTGDQNVRNIYVRILLDAHVDDDRAIQYRYLLTGLSKEFPQAITDIKQRPWVESYLNLRNNPHALDLLELQTFLAMAIPHDLPPTFAREWYRILAETFEQHKAWSLAIKALESMRQVAEVGSIDFWDMELRRLEAYQTQFSNQ